MNPPIRFGIILLQNLPYPELLNRCRLVESLGYDSIWVADHFVNPQKIDGDWFDGWSLLAAIAAQTRRVRIGALVTNIIYRNPAVLARQALTIDHISNGRLIVGIGATSGRDASHPMTGVESWPDPERVRRFGEFIEIVDRMLTHRVTTYNGRHYQVKDARMHPAPVQKPRPPLTIAAAGPTTLKIAARYADTWNTFGGFNLSPEQTLETLKRRSELLDRYCTEIGRDPKAITHSFLVGVTGDKPFESMDAFHDFIGRYREIGFREFIFYYGIEWPAAKCLTREMLERVIAAPV